MKLFRFFINRNKQQTLSMIEENTNYRNGDDGFTYATLIVSLLSVAVIILLVTFFFWSMRQKDNETKRLLNEKDEEFKILLHNKDTEAAYKFTWVKNQLNQMATICREKAEKIEMWQKHYNLTTKRNPPLELLTGQNKGDCVAAAEIPEMPKDTKEEKK